MNGILLINASNLHAGGGVQVATSFILEILRHSRRFELRYLIYVSSVVCENLSSQGVNVADYEQIEVLNIFGLQALSPNLQKKFKGFDAVFTIFGPLYLPTKIDNHIVGFAQPWILQPQNEISRTNGMIAKIKDRLKFAIQWQFFKFSADRLVVELPHVKDRLIEFKKIPAHRVDVVSNCFSQIYLEPSKWQKLPSIIPEKNGTIRLGYLTRAYPHKNLAILVPAVKELSNLSNQKFEFFVTLNEAEWQSCSVEFRQVVKNVGPLTVAQCPSFYTEMDGVIFTSLLECFSATPLEAMVMRKPLFASDRGFVRDVCLDFVNYIDPIDARDIARKIITWFIDTPAKQRESALDSAYQHVRNLPAAHDRALSYMQIIENQLKS